MSLHVVMRGSAIVLADFNQRVSDFGLSGCYD